jgi:predicted RNA-binding Zn-ribbon protein involved in translation (DUF1610 family)
MKWKYACPHCKAILNPNVKIVLAVRRGRKRGLILLSPRPGNYKSICDSDFSDMMEEGTLVDFACPACGELLTSRASRKLAELLLLVPDQKDKRIQFSRIYGEHATFILNGETVTPYGEDAGLYDEVNFFGV